MLRHAPNHLRLTFLDVIDEFMAWNQGEPEPNVEHIVGTGSRQIPISKACTLLWNCTDYAPRHALESLADSDLKMKRRTYAACARTMHADIKRSVSAASAGITNGASVS
jgi:hypothetical protein